MKAKHELDRTENVIETKASIYYLVKGRKKTTNTEDEEYYEEFFVDDDPIEARKKAFSYYLNYISILQEHRILQPTHCSYIINEFLKNDNRFNSIELQKLGTGPTNYKPNFCFDRGVGLYMVVNYPINYMNKKDKKNDRFLIHGAFNFVDADIKEMIEGVIREYGYYCQFKYNKLGYEEQIDFYRYAMGFGLYTIISTPYNWIFNWYLNRKSQNAKTIRRLKYLQNLINTGCLEKSAFETRLSKHKLIKIVASFLNSNGGTLFYGIDQISRGSQNVFSKVKPDFFKTEMQKVLKNEFGYMSNRVSISFIEVNQKITAVFKVENKGNECIFINENNTKKFFVRSDKGIEQIKDPNLLMDYCVSRKSEDKTIDDILDML